MTASEIDTIRILLEESEALANDGLVEYEYESIEDSEMPLDENQMVKLLDKYSGQIKDGKNFIDCWSEFRGFIHEWGNSHIGPKLNPDVREEWEAEVWDRFWMMVKIALNAK